MRQNDAPQSPTRRAPAWMAWLLVASNVVILVAGALTWRLIRRRNQRVTEDAQPPSLVPIASPPNPPNESSGFVNPSSPHPPPIPEPTASDIRDLAYAAELRLQSTTHSSPPIVKPVSVEPPPPPSATLPSLSSLMPEPLKDRDSHDTLDQRPPQPRLSHRPVVSQVSEAEEEQERTMPPDDTIRTDMPDMFNLESFGAKVSQVPSAPPSDQEEERPSSEAYPITELDPFEDPPPNSPDSSALATDKANYTASNPSEPAKSPAEPTTLPATPSHSPPENSIFFEGETTPSNRPEDIKTHPSLFEEETPFVLPALPPPPGVGGWPMVGSDSHIFLTSDTGARYLLGSKVAKVASSSVYEGFDAQQQRVAIKLLDQGLAPQQSRPSQRFEKEAHTLLTLRHEHIVQIKDVGLNTQPPFIVTEFLDGHTLLDRMREGPTRFDLKARLHTITQVLDGLSYTHRRTPPLVHRNLNPVSIIVTSTGHAKIRDFGLAKNAEHTALTDPGNAVGTVSYMAPEQLNISVYLTPDPRIDLFSVGVMLYELMSGHHPFFPKERPPPHEDMGMQLNLAHAIISNAPHPIEDPVVGPLPPRLLQIIQTSLAKNPEHRFQTAHTFAVALREQQR